MSTPPALVSAASASPRRRSSKSPAPSAMTLDEENGDRGEGDAPAEGRGQRDGREAVEEGLGGERSVVPGQAILDRTEHRERADAEEHACGEEPLADRGRARAREPALGGVAEALETSLDPHRLAGEPAQEHGADDDQRVRVPPRERVVHAEDERREAEACEHALLDALRKARAHHGARERAEQHRADVDERPDHRPATLRPPGRRTTLPGAT